MKQIIDEIYSLWFMSCLAKAHILLIEEMCITAYLVYNKHSGKLIRFVNLGDLNSHLLESERAIQGENESDTPILAKTTILSG